MIKYSETNTSNTTNLILSKHCLFGSSIDNSSNVDNCITFTVLAFML